MSASLTLLFLLVSATASAEPAETVTISESDRTVASESGAILQLAVAHDDRAWGIIASGDKGVAYLSLSSGSDTRWSADEWRVGQDVVAARAKWNKRAEHHELLVSLRPAPSTELDFATAKQKLLAAVEAEEMTLDTYRIWESGNRVRLEGTSDDKRVSAAVGRLSGELDLNIERRRSDDRLPEPFAMRVDIPLTNDAAAVTPLTLRAAGLRDCGRLFPKELWHRRRNVIGKARPDGDGFEVELRRAKEIGAQAAACIEGLVLDAFEDYGEAVNFQIAFVPTKLEAHGAGETVSKKTSVSELGRSSKKAKSPETRVSLGKPKIKGTLDEDQVRRVLVQRLREFRYCYDTAVQRNPELTGDLVLSFTVAASGRVTRAEVATGSFDDVLDECLTGKMKLWVFPKPKLGSVIVSQPLTFGRQ